MPDLKQALALLIEAHKWLDAGKYDLAKLAKEEAERTMEREELKREQ